MKKKFLIICLVWLFGSNVSAQENYRGTPPPIPIKPTISVPEFLDGKSLKEDIMKLRVLRKIYLKLKKDKIRALYQYSFFIDTNGKIELSGKETIKFLKEINRYVETVFYKYRWKPAYKLNCKTCFVKTFGMLEFHLNTKDEYINCCVTVNNEKAYKVFEENIDMKSVLKE